MNPSIPASVVRYTVTVRPTGHRVHCEQPEIGSIQFQCMLSRVTSCGGDGQITDLPGRLDKVLRIIQRCTRDRTSGDVSHGSVSCT